MSEHVYEDFRPSPEAAPLSRHDELAIEAGDEDATENAPDAAWVDAEAHAADELSRRIAPARLERLALVGVGGRGMWFARFEYQGQRNARGFPSHKGEKAAPMGAVLSGLAARVREALAPDGMLAGEVDAWWEAQAGIGWRPFESRPWALWPAMPTLCSVCLGQQRETPSGPVCALGHGGAAGVAPVGADDIDASA